MNKRLTQFIQPSFFNHESSQKSPDSIEQNNLHREYSPDVTIQQPDKKIMFNLLINSQDYKSFSKDIKHLLLDRFKQRKQILQSSSIYIDTGKIKKKNHTKDRGEIISQMKETSLEKLPYLNLQKNKKSSDRLSQTIDTYTSLNKSFSFERSFNDSSPSNLTLQSSKTLGRTKLHLSKRKSFDQQGKNLSSSFNMDNRKDQNYIRQGSPLTNKTTNYLGFNEEMKKKYLKSIVDRYFPNEESQNESNQLKSIKKSNSTSPEKEPSSKSKGAINESKRQSFTSDKLPSLKLIKKQSKISKQSKLHQNQSQQLNHLPQSETKQQQSKSIFIKSNSSVLSMSQSYLLESIEEDEEEIDGHKNNYNKVQDFFNNNSSADFLQNSSKSQYFSSINGNRFSTELIMNSSSYDLIDMIKDPHTTTLTKPRQKQIKIYQNHSFSIFKVKHTFVQNLSQSNDLKTFSISYEFRKYFLNQPAIELKKRELKAKEIIMNLCGLCFGQMWQEDPFDMTCLKLNITKNSPPCPGKMLPLTLSKLLYKISPQMQSGSSTFLLVKPNTPEKPNSFLTQQTLLENSHQGLLALLLNLSLPLSQLSSTLINNRISLNNIFFRDFNSFAINEWSYSYFKQQFVTQNKKFQKRLEPILKNQFGQWLVTPEYLAPQILENLCYSRDQVIKYWVKREGKKMQKSIVKQHDLFVFGNKADVWSMGLMILEIITLIPVWIGQKSIVENRKNPSIVPRKGFLFSQKRDLLKILTKQSYLKENLNKILRVQSQSYQIDEWLIKLLHRMLDLNPQSRISFEEIVNILKSERQKMKT